ncbi:hypothetical protein D3C77_745250 [compost metagenome]
MTGCEAGYGPEACPMGLIQASKRAGFARLAPNLLSAIGEYIEQSRVVVSEYSEKGAKLLRPLLFAA